MILFLDPNCVLCLYTEQCISRKQTKYEPPQLNSKQKREIRRIRRDVSKFLRTERLEAQRNA